MQGVSRLLSARAVRRMDAGVVVWVVVWVVLGALVWHDIGAQARLAGDVIKVGAAVGDTGKALGVVGGLPLVGGQIGGLADRIGSMGEEVVGNGRSSRDAVARLAVTAGLAAAILPAALVLLLYVPVRLTWRRDVRDVADELAQPTANPAFEQYLARRAISALPWDEVRAITPDPWAAVERGDVRGLADAELSRLGLSRPA